MGSLVLVIAITLAFAAANLFAQLAALEAIQRRDISAQPNTAVTLEHPFSSRIDGMPRTRTARRDLQRAIGHDFASPDVEQHIWPPDRRT